MGKYVLSRQRLTSGSEFKVARFDFPNPLAQHPERTRLKIKSDLQRACYYTWGLSGVHTVWDQKTWEKTSYVYIAFKDERDLFACTLKFPDLKLRSMWPSKIEFMIFGND